MPEDDATNPDLIEGLSVKSLFAQLGSDLLEESDQGVERESPHGGMILGAYVLLEEIDRGGMGIVYKARQAKLNRLVAVKVLRSGDFASAEELGRFQSEAEILGQLDHPNIVPVYDVGESEGQPYLAMKLIEGGSLLAQAERFQQDLEFAVGVIKKASAAIQAAHGSGILHRDLKPANILLDKDGEPHITDFGLSRRLNEDSSLTLTGAIMGSPNYIAPEQALEGSSKVTTAADIYGLGTILYQLLTGRPPFKGETPIAVIRKVTETDPTSPSSLNPKVDRDLETICLKCLHRDPQRRYPSAQALVDELSSWERGEPIEARPIGRVEGLKKWARRHPVRALLGIVMLLVALGFVIMNAVYQLELRESRDTAIREERRAVEANVRLNDTVSRLQFERAEQEFISGQQREGIHYLIALLDRDPSHRPAAERLAHEWERRQIALEAKPALWPGEPLERLAYSQDGSVLAGASRKGKIYVYHASEDELLLDPIDFGQRTKRVALSTDGAVVMASSNIACTLWDTSSGEVLKHWQKRLELQGSALHPAGVHFFVSHGAKVHMMDLQGNRERSFEHPQPIAKRTGINLSPDGETMVTMVGDTLYWWDVRTGELRSTMEETEAWDEIVFSGNSSRLMTREGSRNLQLWDTTTQQPIGDSIRTTLVTRTLSMNRRGDRCALSLAASRLEVMNLVDQSSLMEPVRHVGEHLAVVFRPQHDHILTAASGDGAVRFWDLQLPHLDHLPSNESYTSTHTWLSRDWSLRLQRGLDLEGHLSTSDQRRRFPFEDKVWMVSGSPDGKLLFLTTLDSGHGKVYLLDPETLEKGRLIYQAEERLFTHPTPDGEALIITHERKGFAIWDIEDRRLCVEQPEAPGAWYYIGISPDSRWFTLSDLKGTVTKWSVATGNRLGELLQHTSHVSSLAISTDHQMAISGGTNGEAIWWDLRAEPAQRLGSAQFLADIHWVAFSPYGEKYFLIGSRDGSFQVWDTDSRKMLCQVEAHELALTSARFTPDGHHVLTISMDGTARLWDARTGMPVTMPLRHDDWWAVPEVPDSPDWVKDIASHPGMTRATTKK